MNECLHEVRQRQLPVWFLGLALIAVASPAIAADKPAWLTDVSATVRESYDDNLYLSGVNPQYLPATYALPGGSVAALKNKSSSVTTVAPKLGVSFLPWTGTNFFSQCSLTYAPEFTIYQDAGSETHYDHRFTAKLKGQTDNWNFNFDESFLYVDGSKAAPTYPGNLVTAYNTVAPRERRDQTQDRASLIAQRNWESWFIRPSASLVYYDLHTLQFNSPGYQNYATRFDAHGGVDLGYKLSANHALTLGSQIGHQGQEKFSFGTYESSSDFVRLLGGAEGKLGAWLTYKFQAGPDLRYYDAAAPVSARHKLTYYDEGSFTAKLSGQDTLTLEGRQFQWVSCLGNVPYFDTTASLTWHHRCTEAFALDFGGKYLIADYRSGGLPPCQRVDTEYCLTTGLSYAVTRHLAFSLGAEIDFGRNALQVIPDPASTRDFHRVLITAGTTWQF